MLVQPSNPPKLYPLFLESHGSPILGCQYFLLTQRASVYQCVINQSKNLHHQQRLQTFKMLTSKFNHPLELIELAFNLRAVVLQFVFHLRSILQLSNVH